MVLNPLGGGEAPAQTLPQDANDPFACGSDFDARKFMGTIWKTRENKVIDQVRSFFWALLLGAVGTDKPGLDPWITELNLLREKYSEMKERHAPKLDLKNTNPQFANPLAPPSADNPWAKRHEDEEILEEIWKDVERTYQEFEIYRKETTRRQLQQVLYNYCKERNAEYRQGMNELCAVLLFVVATNSTSPLLGKYNLAPKNSNEIEADTYYLFDRLMAKGCGHMFLTEGAESAERRKEAMKNQQSHAASMGALKSSINTSTIPDANTALLARIGHVYHTVFKDTDSALYGHLHRTLNIAPQLFLLKWIRCLFTRELTLDQVVQLWDALFMDGFVRNKGSGTVVDDASAVSTGEVAQAASGCFPLIDYLAASFAVAIRQQLLKEDYTGCLQLLLRYPSPDDIWPLVAKAEQLRDPNNQMARLVRSTSTITNNAAPKRGNFAMPPGGAQRSTSPQTSPAPQLIKNPLGPSPNDDTDSMARPNTGSSAAAPVSRPTNPLAPASQPKSSLPRDPATLPRDPLRGAQQNNNAPNRSNGTNQAYRGGGGDIWNQGRSFLGAAASTAVAIGTSAVQTAAPHVRAALGDGGSARISKDKLATIISNLDKFKEDLDWVHFDAAVNELKLAKQKADASSTPSETPRDDLAI